DPSQLDQILANLCINARDAIAGKGKLIIKTDMVSLNKTHFEDQNEFTPGDYVLMAVSDNGRGMDTDTLSHIFEPFFTTKGIEKGTGLGLATVYGIIKQNNGFIDVQSETDKGTTFKIYLPRYDTALDNKTITKENISDMQVHETVILVEDDPTILNMTTEMLNLLGYKVLTAGNAGEAIKIARTYKNKIHLLITDVVMPDMDGKELSEKIHAIYPGLKILFMSGYTANVIAHRGVLDEGVNFIQKPFSKKTLSKKIQETLQERKIT
ncbi:MAG: response regulator, partial [Calditrichaceae bacterium]